MATPLQIEIGLFYYYSAGGDYRHGDFSAPAVSEALAMFVNAGLLECLPPDSERRYQRTKGLEVWVDKLCTIPLPIKQWVVPDYPVTMRRIT